MKRHYVATVHFLVELDEHPNMGNDQAAACDAISEWLRESSEIIDWGYARTRVLVPLAWEHPTSDGQYAVPVEVKVAEPYEEGDLYDLLPKSHKLTQEWP